MTEPLPFADPAQHSLPWAPQPQQQVVTEAASSTAGIGGVGEHLRAAREARNMSVSDAAQWLKLGSRQVEALESEDWPSLPGNTMIRGFVRNYARLLELDSDSLMRRLDEVQLQQTPRLEVSAGTSVSLPHAGSRVERRDRLAALAGLLLLGTAVLAYFYLPGEFWQEKLSVLLGSNASRVAPAPAPAPAVPVSVAPQVAAGESVTVVAPQNATLLSDAPTTGRGLRFSFAQPAWVEIRDGRGQIIFAELSPAGSQREIDGQAPFSVVVGNAAQVTLEYRGRMVELAPRSKDDVARLTVE